MVCDLSAKASASARETPHFAASESLLAPIDTPVLNSSIPGSSGARSPKERVRRRASLPAGPLALGAASIAARMLRLKRIGRSDAVSVPPATPAVIVPVEMLRATTKAACREEMQAMVTVTEGVYGDRALSATSRATLDVRGSWMTVPSTMSSGAVGRTPERAIRPLTARRARSTAQDLRHVPPAGWNGVRWPATKTTARLVRDAMLHTQNCGRRRKIEQSANTRPFVFSLSVHAIYCYLRRCGVLSFYRARTGSFPRQQRGGAVTGTMNFTNFMGDFAEK